MAQTKTLLLIISLAIVFASCQKEPDQHEKNDKLLGTWNFVGMTATLKSTTVAGSGVDEEKIVSSYGFTATNPVGTVTIDETNFKTSGISYTFSADVLTEMYLGGVLFDSFESPFQMTVPPSSASTTYKGVGTDSLHLQSGFLTFDPAAGGGSPMATIPQGFKISWLNDTLVMKSVVSHTMLQEVNGVNAQILVDASQTVKLKK